MILKLKRILNSSFVSTMKGQLFSSTLAEPDTKAEILEHKAYLASKIIDKIK
jgi:hypothetical protein